MAVEIIKQVVIHNWQSLQSVDLVLGRFTVIVGASSSGKTSFIRSLRALASNVRGSGSVTRGATTAIITVLTGEATVSLERTDSSGLYRLEVGGSEEVFTKLAGAVPEAVTRALRILPAPSGGASINFSDQFDRPYLLDDSGASVARTLGELTNVTTIFNAVREVNRRRAAHAATLKTRETDLSELVARAAAFTNLPKRLAACDQAEVAAEVAARLEDRVTRLSATLQALVIAEGVFERSVVRAVPTDDIVTAASLRLTSFRFLERSWRDAVGVVKSASDSAGAWEDAELELHAELHGLLLNAGVCPTCGQAVLNERTSHG